MRDAKRAIIVVLLVGCSWVLVPGRAEAGDLLLTKALQGESQDGTWVPGKVRWPQQYRRKGKGLLIAGMIVSAHASILGILAVTSLIYFDTQEEPEGWDSEGLGYVYKEEWALLSIALGPVALTQAVIGIALLLAGAHNLRKAKRVQALAEGRYPLPVLAVSPDGSGGTLGVFFRF